MKTFLRLKHTLLLPFLFIGLALPQTLAAQRYSVVDLDADDSQSSRAVAINQKGEVTGIISNFDNPQELPDAGTKFFIYSRGKTETFSASMFGNAVLSINAQSEVVGLAYGNPALEARHFDPFVFSHGKFFYLRALLPRTHTLMFAVSPGIDGQNDSGQILCTGLYGEVAVLDHSKLTYLDALSKQRAVQEHQGETGGSMVPIIINGQRTTIFQPNHAEPLTHNLPLGPCKFNNKAHICGMLANGHAFLYADGVCTDVGAPLGFHSCEVAAFNDNDEIVGVCYDNSNAQKMFCYNHNKMMVFGPNQQPAWIKPTAVSNSGAIVGILKIPNIQNNRSADHTAVLPYPMPGTPTRVIGELPADRAFIFADGRISDLNNFLDTKSGWVLEEATGINDAGQIVGTGTHNGKTRAFLLTPIP